MKKLLITLLVVTCALTAQATKFYFNAPSTWTQPWMHIWNCDPSFANAPMTQVPGIPNWYYIEVPAYTTSTPGSCNIIFNNANWSVQLANYIQTSAMPEYMIMGSNIIDLVEETDSYGTHQRGTAKYLGGEGNAAPVFNKMVLYFQKPNAWSDAQTRIYIQTSGQGNAYVLCDEALKPVADADGWYYIDFYYLSNQTANNYIQFRNGTTGDYTTALNVQFTTNGALYLKVDGSATAVAPAIERPSVITYCGK